MDKHFKRSATLSAFSWAMLCIFASAVAFAGSPGGSRGRGKKSVSRPLRIHLEIKSPQQRHLTLHAFFDKREQTLSVNGAKRLAKIHDGAIYGFGKLRLHVEYSNEFRFGIHASSLELRITPKFFGGFRARMYQHVDAAPAPERAIWYGKNGGLDKVFSERAAALDSIHGAVDQSVVLPETSKDLIKTQIIDSDPAMYRSSYYSVHVDNNFQIQIGRQIQLGVQGVVQFFAEGERHLMKVNVREE